jgi:hypothetical protein
MQRSSPHRVASLYVPRGTKVNIKKSKIGLFVQIFECLPIFLTALVIRPLTALIATKDELPFFGATHLPLGKNKQFATVRTGLFYRSYEEDSSTE